MMLDWVGQRAFVVCSGPSLALEDCETLRGENVIAVNCSMRKVPFAQALYAADERWWRAYEDEWRGFDGEKYTCTLPVQKRFQEVNHIKLRPSEILGFDGLARGGGSSGYQAANLAFLFGAKTIYLLGVDCKGGGDKNHWHPDHETKNEIKMSNPTPHLYKAWVKRWHQLYVEMSRHGVRLINCSQDTAVTIPKRKLTEVLHERNAA